MRIRTIRPEFFKDDDLADIPIAGRLLFVGLLCMADRCGRLEDRPRKIRAEVFPYDGDSIEVEALLAQLAQGRFIIRYAAGDRRLIQIRTFEKHQRISGKEAESESQFPAPASGPTGDTPAPVGAQPGKHLGSSGEASETAGMEDGIRSMDKRSMDKRSMDSPQPPSDGGECQGGKSNQPKRKATFAKVRDPNAARPLPRENLEPLRSRMLDVCILFDRRASQTWSAKEIEALMDARIKDMPAEDWEADFQTLWHYYSSPPSGDDKDLRRQKLITLLSNLSDSIETARREFNAAMKRQYASDAAAWSMRVGYSLKDLAVARSKTRASAGIATIDQAEARSEVDLESTIKSLESTTAGVLEPEEAATC